MIDRARALRPLQDAAPAIDRLETYESPAELAEALRATWHAVDSALRTLLRSDTAAPDELRMKAMSRAELPHDALVAELRRRDLISLQLAGRMHELKQSAARVEGGTVRPGDADVAADVVGLLRDEITHGAKPARRTDRPAHAYDPAGRTATRTRERADAAFAAGALDDDAVDSDDFGDDAYADGDVTRRRDLRSLARGPVVLVAATVLLLVVAISLVFVFGRPNDMAQGVDAFRAGRMAIAEQHFRAALARNDDNVTARLYLGRILRAQGRQQEAAEMLRAAATAAPRDAAVRRELGYLFLDLERAPQAAEQFRQAVELDPEEPLGWVGLYEALVRSGDPRAEESLRRAPPAAQAMIRTRQQ